MYPFRTCLVALIEQLVEHSVVKDSVVQLAQVLYATHLQVRCFPTQVLARRLATNGFVQCGATIATRDVYGRTESNSGRFEDIPAQRTQIIHHLL